MQPELAGLITEGRLEASLQIDRLPTGQMLEIINDADAGVAAAVRRAIPAIANAIDQIASRVDRGGRLFYIGAGTSGRLGVLDAAECPPTFGVSPDLVQGIIAGGEAALSRATEASEDDAAEGAAALSAHGFTAADCLVGIAASGRTPYVMGALECARKMGALTIGLCCVPDGSISRAAEIAIEAPAGPEILTGSTRMKAGTATKLILNMISTGLMIRLGYTYGNLMVNVQPKNDKLLNRAQRIVAEAAAVDGDAAAAALQAAGGAVKTAIAMARLQLGRAEAEARLAAAGGKLSEVLDG